MFRCNTPDLNRQNTSKQESGTAFVIPCQYCNDPRWMVVETNQLGLIEKLINRHGQTKSQPLLAAFVLILNSAVIWNVPAVHCTQNIAAFPKPTFGICSKWRGAGEARLRAFWGDLGAPWGGTLDGQKRRSIATGWHSLWLMYVYKKKTGIVI